MPKASSILKALDSIDDVMDEVLSYSVGDKIRIPKLKGIRKLDSLDDNFWNSIRDIIKTMLIRNYNAIRITNSPKYANWKRKAKEEGTSVNVLKDGSKDSVKYIKPSLRTGVLRDRIKDVKVSPRIFRSGSVNQGVVEYELEVSDLYNDYGIRFADLVKRKTGLEIFTLTSSQAQYLLELVVSKLAT